MERPVIDYAVLHRVVAFDHREDFRLRICFDDGTEQEIDLEPLLSGPLFGALRNPSLFREVQIDADFGALVWPNGADIDPMVLYEWSKRVDTGG